MVGQLDSKENEKGSSYEQIFGDFENRLKEADSFIQDGPAKRLEALLQGCSTRREKAERLQFLSSMILFEEQMIRGISFTSAMDSYLDDLLDGLSSGNAKAVQVEARRVEIIISAEDLDKQGAFAFMLLMNTFRFGEIAARAAKGKIDAILELRKIQEKFTKILQTGIPQEQHWDGLLEKCRMSLRREMAFGYRKEHLQDTVVKNTKILKESGYYQDLGERHPLVLSRGVPFFDIYEWCNAQLHKTAEGQVEGPLRDAMLRDLQDSVSRSILVSYALRRAGQGALYELARSQLFDLTQQGRVELRKLRSNINPDALLNLRTLPERLPLFDTAPIDCEAVISAYLDQVQKERDKSKRQDAVQIYTQKIVPAKQKKKKPSDVFHKSAPDVPEDDFKEPAFLCDHRVYRWFEADLDQPLDPAIFWEYADQSYDQQRQAILTHGFSPAVDRYLHLGIEQRWKNKTTGNWDKSHLLPMEMDQVRGIAVFTFDGNGILYHRYFKSMSSQEMIAKFGLWTFKESDFPELSLSSPGAFLGKSTICSDTAEEDPVLGMVNIYDKRLNIHITLFRTKI